MAPFREVKGGGRRQKGFPGNQESERETRILSPTADYSAGKKGASSKKEKKRRIAGYGIRKERGGTKGQTPSLRGGLRS